MSRIHFKSRWLAACSLAALALLCTPPLAANSALRSVAPASRLSVQESAPSPDLAELTPEILVAHPGYFSGDAAAAERDVLAAIEGNPESPLVLDGVLRLWSLGADGESAAPERIMIPRYLKLADRVTDAEASYWLRRLAHRRIGRLRYGPEAPVIPEGLYSDFIEEWHVVGPLGSLDAPVPGVAPVLPGGPAAGLDRAEGPRVFDAEYAAADGVARRWIRAAREPGSAFVPLARPIYPQAGLTYAVAFVRGPDDVGDGGSNAVLELRCSGPIRAWWNGRPAVSESSANPYEQTSRHLAQMSLVRGWNALLVRVPTSGPSAIAARVLAERGGKALRLAQPSTGEGPSQVDWSATGDVRPIVAFDPSFPAVTGPFAPALQALRAMFASRYDAALAAAPPRDDADERAIAAYRLQQLAALEGATHLPEDIGRRRLLGLLETIEASGVDMADVRWVRFSMALGADRPLEALDFADAWIQAAPERAWPRFARCLALAALDTKGAASRVELRALVERFPAHRGAREMLLGSLRFGGAAADSLELAWETLMTFAGSERAMEILIQNLGGSPDPRLKSLLAAATTWSQQQPGSAAARAAVEELAAACADPAERETAAAERALDYPMRPESWRSLSAAKLGVGDRAGALAAIERGLEVRPGDRGLRDTAGRLGKEDPAEAFFSAYAPSVEEALEAADSFGDTSVIEALDLGLIYYYEDGSYHSRSHTLTVPTDRVGADSLLKRPASENTQRIRVLRRGGGILEPALTEGEWVLPSLGIGDVVEEVWDRFQGRTRGRRPAPNSWRFASFEKAFAISRWVVFVPDGLAENPAGDVPRGRFEVKHFEGAHEELAFEGGTVHVFTDSKDRQVPEAGMPSYAEILPLAAFGSDRALDNELEAWGARIERASALPEDLEEDIAQFIARHGGAGEITVRARELHAALDERLQTYEGEDDAASVWLSRRGTPLYLLGAIYERANVPFRWVVLERPIAPELDPEPVTLFAGERGLARAVIRVTGDVDSPDDQGHWVVPGASPGLPFGLVDDSLWGVTGWELAPGEAGTGKPTPVLVDAGGREAPWDADIELSYVVEPDGSALVKGKITDASPGGIVSMRRVLQASVEQREGLARSQAASVARGVDISDAQVILDGSEGEGVVVIFEGRAENVLEAQGEERLIRLPFLPLQLAQRFGPAARRWPLALRAPARLRCDVSVRWPEGLGLKESPQPVSEIRDGFRVELIEREKSERSLRYQQIYVQRGAVIPAAEMPGFTARMSRLEAEFLRPLRFLR